jgi:hypothetical protein
MHDLLFEIDIFWLKYNSSMILQAKFSSPFHILKMVQRVNVERTNVERTNVDFFNVERTNVE